VAEEKSETDSAKLAWPPTREDLERLYIEQKLSAAKIAKVYDLEYASPKTAESTILHHLKKNGISRRDAAAHIRKVTDSMVDEWVVRYQKGESLKQIAGNMVDSVTVFNHLRKRGLRLRDKVEAQIKAVTKHQKQPFSGDYLEMAYLAGLTAGDLGAVRHGRAVRAKLSTTHPAMSRLFRDLLQSYGPIYEYPRLDRIAGYEWSLDCDLDSSFEPLFAAKIDPMKFVIDEASFLSFLAGFFDAEGSIHYHRKQGRGSFELTLTNLNVELLRKIADKLREFGVNNVLRKVWVDRAKAIESGITNPGEFMWRIIIWKHSDVNRLLKAMPLRHSEKTAKAAIAIQLGLRETLAKRQRILTEWKLLLQNIRQDCQNYLEAAKNAIETESKSIES
jgi:LAGLIDADG DNA endonuclease family protein